MPVPEPLFASTFQLAPDGQSEATADDLKRLAAYFRDAQSEMLGYQWSQDVPVPDGISDFLSFHLDNIGDPMSASLTKLNTKFLEREVLGYFARLWHAPPLAQEDEPANGAQASWGYVLSMGSTEGSLYALWNARDYLNGTQLHADSAEDGTASGDENTAAAGHAQAAGRRKPLLFISEEAHYSFAKAARMVQLETLSQVGDRDWPGQCPLTADGQWPPAVPSRTHVEGDGLVDPVALAKMVDFFAERGYAPVIVLNVGSTFKGAIDSPPDVWRHLQPVLAQHGLLGGQGARQGYWIHIDGALGAGYLPFLEMAHRDGQGPAAPSFDFRLPYVSSIVTSGHKWFGTPYPSGVYMSRNELRVAAPSKPGYTGSPDTTVGGARDGLASLLMWSAISQRPHSAQIDAVTRCMDLAGRAHDEIRATGRVTGRDLRAQRAKNALAVRFRKPAEHVMTAFGLVGQQVPDETGKLHDEAHLFVMPHVTPDTIDRFLHALAEPDAYAPDASLSSGHHGSENPETDRA